MIQDMKNAGLNPYPHYFNTTITVDKYIENYDHLDKETRLLNVIHSISGRVLSIRNSSKKLFFMTITQNNKTLQLFSSINDYEFDEGTEENDKINIFYKTMNSIVRGDIIGGSGYVGKTKNNELSLFVNKIQVLTPCLKMLPMTRVGIQNEETRSRQRYLDLMINKSSMNPFIIRNKVIKFIRNYFDNNNFMEVQTPILIPQAGGAIAKPFITVHNDLNRIVELRIAPELYLKQLVIGGIDRVYEIGNQFRNESIDRTHSPEFTSMEAYMAYEDYNTMLNMTELLISSLANHLHNTYKIKSVDFDTNEEIEIDFTPPYKRYDFIQEIENQSGMKLPNDFTTDESRLYLDNMCKKFNIDCSEPRSTSRLLDKLAGHFIEPLCKNPSFIINHPSVMSPLAKWHRDNKNITERFELFINGYEFANSYTELNDPFIQKSLFEDQAKAKANGDEEAQNVDNSYIEALEHGLPPTAGLGIGIDRLVMLMAGVKKIQDVIFFPLMNNEN